MFGINFWNQICSFISEFFQWKFWIRSAVERSLNNWFNKNDWKLTQELTLSQIKRFNENVLIKDKNASALKLYKESATKSYRYIGKINKDNNVLTFNADAYKLVAQNQISMF